MLPLVVLVGWIIGKPFYLDFDPFITIMLTLSVIHAYFVSSDGNSNWCGIPVLYGHSACCLTSCACTHSSDVLALARGAQAALVLLSDWLGAVIGTLRMSGKGASFCASSPSLLART